MYLIKRFALFVIVIMSVSVFGNCKKVHSIHIELYPDKAPITVKNFYSYIDSKFYNGTIFHRVIPNFMIQGGGFTPGMSKKASGSPIKNEAKNGLANERGTIAMARTGEVDSATAQFFINVKDNMFLNHRDDTNYGYAVFGKVVKGMDVVDKIKSVKTTTKGFYRNVPVDTVKIVSIERAKGKKNQVVMKVEF